MPVGAREAKRRRKQAGTHAIVHYYIYQSLLHVLYNICLDLKKYPLRNGSYGEGKERERSPANHT